MVKAEEKVKLINKVGLHARPASLFVQTARKFKCKITVRKVNGDRTVDAKSILGVLSLGAEKNDDIIIMAEGDDALDAVKTLVELVSSGFGGEE